MTLPQLHAISVGSHKPSWRIVPPRVAALLPFDELYRKYAPGAFRRARRMLGSDAPAHDVVQDLFLSLLERPEQFGGRSALSTFIYSAVTHACLKRIRDQSNRLRLLDEHGASVPLHALRAPSPEQLVTLHRLLALMPEPLSQVAVYYHLDELSQADIARILDCSERRVSQLLENVRTFAKGEGAVCKS
jgi:RNA polymerase sigma factor (sigma-70 family)